MPLVGQDRFKSAVRAARERTVDKIRQVRSGEWGRIPQGRSAVEKTMETRQRGIQRYQEVDSALKSQQ